MKTDNSNLAILCLAIFFVQLATNLLTFGVITHTSYNFPGLEKVSLSVFFGAVGSLLALVISNYLKRSIQQNFILYCKILAFTMILSSIGLSLLPQLKTSWLFSYLVYNVSISLVTSTLLSSLHALGADQLLKHNRYLQITSTVGVLLGVSISPLLSIGGQFQVILTATLILSILTAATSLRYFSNISVKLNSIQNDKLNSRFDVNHYLLFYVIFLVWLLGGFFYTIEVPILKSRFFATSSEISFVFLLSVVANLISLLLLKKKFNSKNLFVIFLVSSFFCVIIAPLYALNYYKILIPILVAGYGAMNGIFNFSYSSIIQSKESSDSQRSGFLFVKFISNLGILISSITSYYLTLVDLPMLMIYIAFTGIIVFIFFYKKLYSFALGAFLGFLFLSLPVSSLTLLNNDIYRFHLILENQINTVIARAAQKQGVL